MTRFDRKAIEAKVHAYVKDWRALLTKRVEDGRQLLREVLSGPLRFTPDGRTYRFEGEGRDRPHARRRSRITNCCGVPNGIWTLVDLHRARRLNRSLIGIRYRQTGAA